MPQFTNPAISEKSFSAPLQLRVPTSFFCFVWFLVDRCGVLLFHRTRKTDERNEKWMWFFVCSSFDTALIPTRVHTNSLVTTFHLEQLWRAERKKEEEKWDFQISARHQTATSKSDKCSTASDGERKREAENTIERRNFEEDDSDSSVFAFAPVEDVPTNRRKRRSCVPLIDQNENAELRTKRRLGSQTHNQEVETKKLWNSHADSETLTKRDGKTRNQKSIFITAFTSTAFPS